MQRCVTSDPASEQINADLVWPGRPTLDPASDQRSSTAATQDMTTLKLVLVLALVSAASATTENNSLDNIAAAAQDLFNNFTSYWGIDAPSGDQVLGTLTNLSNTMASKMSDMVRSIQTELSAHSGQANEALQSASTNLNRTIAALQTPENKRRVEDLRSSVNSGMQTLAQEARRVKDAVAQDTQGLRSEVSQAFDEAVKAAQRLSERVQTAINEHQASHGKQ